MAKTDTTEKTEPTVKVDRSKYESTRSASGSKSLHNGDEIAQGLNGLNVDEVYDVAAKFGIEPPEGFATLQDKYGHLNDGMQRMNLGNRMRARVTALDKVADKAEADGKKRPADGLATFAKVIAPFRKAADKRVADAAKAKEAKAKEAAEAKKGKAKAA